MSWLAPEKKRKEGMPRSMTQKNRWDCHVKKRENKGESESNSSKSYHHSFHSDTCTSWSRLHDLFLHGLTFLFYNMWNASMPSSFILPWAPKKPYFFSRKRNGVEIALVRNYIHWAIRENHSRNLHLFFQNLSRKTSRWIANLGINECSSMHCSNSQRLKIGRKLKTPWMSTE